MSPTHPAVVASACGEPLWSHMLCPVAVSGVVLRMGCEMKVKVASCASQRCCWGDCRTVDPPAPGCGRYLGFVAKDGCYPNPRKWAEELGTPGSREKLGNGTRETTRS